jgi:hypothetical protein
MISRPLLVDGNSWGAVFTLEKAGDEFPTHTHTDENNHITILAFGAVRCTGHPRYEGKEVSAMPGGTIINWKAGEPHGFVALVDGTTLVNILKSRRET